MNEQEKLGQQLVEEIDREMDREISGSSLGRKSPVCQAEEFQRKGRERGHQRCRMGLESICNLSASLSTIFRSTMMNFALSLGWFVCGECK